MPTDSAPQGTERERMRFRFAKALYHEFASAGDIYYPGEWLPQADRLLNRLAGAAPAEREGLQDWAIQVRDEILYPLAHREDDPLASVAEGFGQALTAGTPAECGGREQAAAMVDELLDLARLTERAKTQDALELYRSAKEQQYDHVVDTLAAAPREQEPDARDDGLCCGFAGSNRCCQNYRTLEPPAPGGINAVFGSWPGDETDEELMEAVRDPEPPAPGETGMIYWPTDPSYPCPTCGLTAHEAAPTGEAARLLESDGLADRIAVIVDGVIQEYRAGNCDITQPVNAILAEIATLVDSLALAHLLRTRPDALEDAASYVEAMTRYQPDEHLRSLGREMAAHIRALRTLERPQTGSEGP